MSLSLRKSGVAIGAALLATAATAGGASAATVTQVSFSSGTLTVQAASGQANLISVADASGGGYRIKELGTGATLGYNVSGLASLTMVSQQEGIVTTTGTVTRVVVRGEDGDDAIVTNGLTSVPASLYGGSGADGLLGGPVGSVLNGGTDDDSVSGGGGGDIITGYTGADELYGNGGNDQFFEADGFADSIDGGAGSDSASIDGNLDSVTSVESLDMN